ncbi:MAG: PhzF family phenazine biosynthesis protein [Pseudomonadota bacterium]
MRIERLASFSDNDVGGNPAGVVIVEALPSASEMQNIAAEIGYSETAFAEPQASGWRVRYFSPESEVPFCGHATIALGGALASRFGSSVYPLHLNDTQITVEGFAQNGDLSAALQSPGTRSKPAIREEIDSALELFSYTPDDLDTRIPPARINAGAEHLVIALRSRALLQTMNYDLDAGRVFMRTRGIVTVMLVTSESERLFHCRNAFASGGVLEDPATGAAAAAFAGYLRDLGWPHGGAIEIVQGEDMGHRSLIAAQFSEAPGSSVRVSGAIRTIVN